MDVGLFPVGTGVTADRIALAEVARAADDAGMSTLWSAGHPFRVNQLSRPYPYSDSGTVPVPATSNSYEQFATLAYLAGITNRIRLGTGVIVSSLLHPVEIAKLVATVDDLCGGRLRLGIGVGWMKEEFDVLEVPWPQRVARTMEGLEATKRIWAEDTATFEGRFYSFRDIMSYPKPRQQPHPPVMFGGTSHPALRRAAQYGDGWFAFCTSPSEVEAGRATISRLAEEAGRTLEGFRVTVAPGFEAMDRDVLHRYADAGADEVVVAVSGHPDEALADSIERLAEELVLPASVM